MTIVNIYNENNNNCVNELISVIRGDMWMYFVRKWSNHSHGDKIDHKCNLCLIMDGLWKLFRAKCILGNIFVQNTEFGDIDTGCRATPTRNSYYCKQHSDYETKFKVGDKFISINPTLIFPTRLSIIFIKSF